MAKVYIATMTTGNTLTVHGQTFFRGRPTVVTEPVLIDYLKGHPNFRVDEKIVADSLPPDEANKKAVQGIRKDLKESGEYVAPTVFDKNDNPTPEPVNPVEETPVAPKPTTTRRGAVSAPRPVSTTKE